jgi:uncharacterized protein (TIGR02246 family)
MAAMEQAPARHNRAEDEVAIRQVVATFADAWNRHDATATVACFADELDHVSVRGRWQRSRAELEETQRQYHATIWQGVTYDPTVEHIRFLRPDIAVVIVQGSFSRSEAREAARSTWVMTNEDGRWVCRAFQQTNIQDIPIAPGSR